VTTPADVVVVGAVGVDTVVYPPDPWSWDGDTEGTLAEITQVVAHGGGYAARGYAALGYRTAFVGHVGNDPEGDLVRRTLAGDGVDLSACVTSGRTAHSVNVMSARGTRRNFYDPRLTEVEPPSRPDIARVLAGARMAHLNIPDWARTVIEPARSQGVAVVVDVQDTPGADDGYRLDFVRGADLLFASGAQLDDPETYARWALAVGPASLVVIGLGAEGCLVVPREAPAQRFPTVELPPQPGSGVAPPVTDTNGAGDSLAVGISSALLVDRLPLADAVHRGLLCARWCCTRRGTSDGLLSAPMLHDMHAG
jgi:acarbose 7IV-phosphotransferase